MLDTVSKAVRYLDNADSTNCMDECAETVRRGRQQRFSYKRPQGGRGRLKLPSGSACPRPSAHATIILCTHNHRLISPSTVPPPRNRSDYVHTRAVYGPAPIHIPALPRYLHRILQDLPRIRRSLAATALYEASNSVLCTCPCPNPPDSHEDFLLVEPATSAWYVEKRPLKSQSPNHTCSNSLQPHWRTRKKPPLMCSTAQIYDMT